MGWTALFEVLFDCTVPLIVVLLSLASFLTFLRRKSCFSWIGMLTVQVATYFLFAAFSLCSGIMLILEHLDMLDLTSAFIRYTKGADAMSEIFVCLTGVVLAIDRVVVMSMPLKYSFYKVSRYFVAVALTLCSILIATLSMSYALQYTPLLVPSLHIVGTWFYVFIAVVLAETCFHVAFFVQYRYYMRKKAVTQHKNKQTNQIVLFQAFSQTFLCTIPNLVIISVLIFSHHTDTCVEVMDIVHDVLFMFNVLFNSIFVLCKMKQKTFVNIVASHLNTK